MTRIYIETEEGKAIADALVILGGYCLHRMSAEGTGRHKFVPQEDPKRTPEDFVRRSMSHLLERFRKLMNIPTTSMYEQDRGTNRARGAYSR